MIYEYYNPNPYNRNAGDCVIRAISKAEGKDWENIYIDLAIEGMMSGELPNANYVWDKYLRRNGYQRYGIPNTCPDCYTVEMFAEEHPIGTYILATGTHAVTVKDGVIYDSYNSSDKIPIYFYSKERR